MKGMLKRMQYFVLPILLNCRHENVCPILPRQYRKKQNSPESKSEPCMSQNYLKKETINHTNSEIPPELQVRTTFIYVFVK